MILPLLLAMSVSSFAAQGSAPASSANKLPPAEDQAKARLNASPRHGEMIEIPVGKKKLNAWIVYPERSDKAPVVIVIQEIYGLSDWIRAVADQLADEGYIAIAPDLVTGLGPNGGGTDAFASRDDVVKAVRQLKSEDVMKNLDAVRAYAMKLPAADAQHSASIGFCWGGGMSFQYAAQQPELNAAIVYYGTPPEAKEDYEKINAAVAGFYGGDDARVTSTVEGATAEMKAAGKSYTPHVFAGAGHGFLRAQTERNGANAKAAQQAWSETLAFFKKQMQ